MTDVIHLLLRLGKHVTINQAQRIAKDMVQAGTEPKNLHFDLVGPTGRITCKWLDPFIGLFQRLGSGGFLRVAEFEMLPDVHVEAIQMPLHEVEDKLDREENQHG